MPIVIEGKNVFDKEEEAEKVLDDVHMNREVEYTGNDKVYDFHGVEIATAITNEEIEKQEEGILGVDIHDFDAVVNALRKLIDEQNKTAYDINKDSTINDVKTIYDDSKKPESELHKLENIDEKHIYVKQTGVDKTAEAREHIYERFIKFAKEYGKQLKAFIDHSRETVKGFADHGERYNSTFAQRHYEYVKAHDEAKLQKTQADVEDLTKAISDKIKQIARNDALDIYKKRDYITKDDLKSTMRSEYGFIDVHNMQRKLVDNLKEISSIEVKRDMEALKKYDREDRKEVLNTYLTTIVSRAMDAHPNIFDGHLKFGGKDLLVNKDREGQISIKYESKFGPDNGILLSQPMNGRQNLDFSRLFYKSQIKELAVAITAACTACDYKDIIPPEMFFDKYKNNQFMEPLYENTFNKAIEIQETRDKNIDEITEKAEEELEDLVK